MSFTPLGIPAWKRSPFLRILPPLIAGIVLQWYLQTPIAAISLAFICFGLGYLVFYLLPAKQRFGMFYLQGICIHLLLVAAGALLAWQKDIRNHPNWYGHRYTDSSYLLVTINEPVTEKTKSYKADALVAAVITNGQVLPCTGKLLLYFAKDSTGMPLQYGDQLLINKKLQLIKNSGNPGAFNYQRYAAFQQIIHNVFLKPTDWQALHQNKANAFKQLLFAARHKILSVLQANIGAGKDELGIAEALVIGYTNDLDKDLVQAYSNTGVVHIIAISGMHLGLIYALLAWLFAKLPIIKKSKNTQAIAVLPCLWLFALLTGGSASVIRSAVMFSFITVGQSFFRQSSTYNSLAASASVMLCYNPFYLWDVGFQLSYLAVLGIVLYQKPLQHFFYSKNKYLYSITQAAALTTAAQVLTFPVCIYYFHQFPMLFLITNLVAVPLSTGILYACILLLAFSWWPPVAALAGKLAGAGLWCMNQFIQWINQLSFAVWDKITANLLTTWLLYAAVLLIAGWLLQQKKQWLKFGLYSLAGFVSVHAVLAWQTIRQQKVIIYNVPQKQAIDFVNGSQYQFIGDSILLQDGLLQNFHLKPSRILLQLNQRVPALPALLAQHPLYRFGNTTLLLLDDTLSFKNTGANIVVDAVLVSRNVPVQAKALATVFNCKTVVLDASNSLWKIEKWKQACDELNLRHHSIPEQGAFVMDIE
jgi:competence protein ComEC